MDERNIPIDINNNKLLDWLVSRRHVSRDWQRNVLKVREKINAAIQDMPEHEQIIKLLSGQHINYFHCLKIVDILKETEADTRNLFGRYGSQRMKDWQDIVSCYQKDNIYLAEAAQTLIRNVSYEIPSLRKQVAKLEQLLAETGKKIKDLGKNERAARNEFSVACEQLGIAGKNIRNELLDLLDQLPQLYEVTAAKIQIIKPALDLYCEFSVFLSEKQALAEVLPLLKFVISKGNTTTYEYIYGEKPDRMELQADAETEEKTSPEEEDQINFGDNFEFEEPSKIDWSTPSTDEDFEIVSHTDIVLEESGIVLEKSSGDWGVARNLDALTLLDNPETREQIINELMELEAFLKIRLFELSSDVDVLTMSQMQDAPIALQMQTVETVTAMSDCTNVVLSEFLNKRITHLHNIKHSSKYVDILTLNLKQKLTSAERMKRNISVLEEQIVKYQLELVSLEPVINQLIDTSKQLQKEVTEDISQKYKGRVVNIVGGINML